MTSCHSLSATWGSMEKEDQTTTLSLDEVVEVSRMGRVTIHKSAEYIFCLLFDLKFLEAIRIPLDLVESINEC